MSQYRESSDPGVTSQGANIIPAHLRIENPYEVDMKGEARPQEAEFNRIIDHAQEHGHDGVILRNTYDQIFSPDRPHYGSSDVFMAFHPHQIKSATGNVGTFSRGSSAIHLARGGMVEPMQMPFGGRGAAGYSQAEAEGRTFEPAYEPGSQRFEISDEDMRLRGAHPVSREEQEKARKRAENAGALYEPRQYKNIIDQTYYKNTRGQGILPLHKAIEHPELFKNYPFLKNTKISMDPTIPSEAHYEQPYVDHRGDMQGDHIVVRKPEDKNSIIHEIQHAIQHFEKFAGRGANSDEIYYNMASDPGIRDELNKHWQADNPGPLSLRSIAEKRNWVDNRLHQMAYAMYMSDPGEIEARVAAERGIGKRGEWPIESQGHWLSPRQHIDMEMQSSIEQARKAGTMSMWKPPPSKFAKGGLVEPDDDPLAGQTVPAPAAPNAPQDEPEADEQEAEPEPSAAPPAAPPAPSGPAPVTKAPKKAKKPLAPPEPAAPVSPEIKARIGERPTDEEQGDIHDRIAGRLAKELPNSIPMRPLTNKKGEFQADEKGNPKWEPEHYDIANAPMLEKQGKALGWMPSEGRETKALRGLDRKQGIAPAKAPEGTQDTLDKGDLYYLKHNKNGTPSDDRLRVSHLNKVSAVSSYADKLVEFFDSIKHDKEVMDAKGWYPEVERLLKEHFGKHADMVANILAATSAGTGVRPNFTMAMNAVERYLHGDFEPMIKLYRQGFDMLNAGTLRQRLFEKGITPELLKNNKEGNAKAFAHWIVHHGLMPTQLHGKINPKTGEFEGTKYGFNSHAVMKVLAHTWHEEAEGPKTVNYGGNLSGRSLQATIDMWAARTMRRLGYEGHTDKPWLYNPPSEGGVNNVDFGLSQLAFREAAKRVGMEPRELQAILWFAEQKLYQSRGWEKWVDPNERDYRPMVKALMEHGPLTTHLPGKEPKLRSGQQRAPIARTGLQVPVFD